MTDFVLIAPNSTTARLSASTIQRMDEFFFRGDAGFDLIIDRPSGSTGPSVFFRANLAAGYRVPDAVDLAFELVNIAAVNGDVDGGITERFIHTAAITARTPGINQFHLGTVFPLDEDARGRRLDPVVRLSARDELRRAGATGARSSPGTGSSRRRCCCRSRAAA